MRETIAKLVALQAIDDEARAFMLERDALESEILEHKALLSKMQVNLTEKQAKLSEVTRWYDDKMHELETDREKVVKEKAKLQKVTKNKEYMAQQRVIEQLREGIVNREDEIKKLVEAVEEFKGTIAVEEKKIAELTAQVKAEEAASADRLQELEKQISAVNSRKKDVTKGVKKPVVTRYNRILRAREGIVIVPVRNKACSACNFAVPAQQLVRIQLGNTLEVCRHCSRLLYFDAESAGDVEGAEAEAAGA